MLEIVRYNEDEYEFPCLIVLGCFDGLHIGHQDLLKKAKLQAKINGLDLGVMLFTDGKGGKQLYTFDERISFLEAYNVKFVLQIDFNEEFKKIKPLDFLACLEDKLNVKAYMSGKDFRFGNGKKGKSSTLKNYAEDEENGVWYMSVKDVTHGDEKISTTWIKSLLDGGDIKTANELLGRNYSVCGCVMSGADRGGRLMGFPTLNIEYPADKHEVKQGVYAVKCTVGGESYDGIANYGARPTFGENGPVLEVHLRDYSGECYGETVTVEFVSYIRDTVKFGGAEELAEQLKKDLLVLDGAEPAPAAASATDEEPLEAAVAAAEPVEELAVAEDAPEDVLKEPEEVTEQPAREVAEEVCEEPSETVEETSDEQEEEVAGEIVSEAPDDEFEDELNETVDVSEAEPEEEGDHVPMVSDELDGPVADEGEFNIEDFVTEEPAAELAEEISGEENTFGNNGEDACGSEEETEEQPENDGPDEAEID